MANGLNANIFGIAEVIGIPSLKRKQNVTALAVKYTYIRYEITLNNVFC